MSNVDFDAIVVGAGAVGLACAYALSRRGLAVLVLEKEDGIGQGVSSRNSEVVHAGLYYPKGSLKARLCIQGRRLLYPFLEAHNVAFNRCSKLVVATYESELPRLDQIYAEGSRVVDGLQRISRDDALALEPQLACVGAILSTQSGVFDSHGYMLALQGRIEDACGIIAFSTPFEGAFADGDGLRVNAGGQEPVTLSCRYLVAAPGLSAQSVANQIDAFPKSLIPSAHFGKGMYYRLAGKVPFDRLIYPLPIRGALGTHYRRDLGGQGVFGPDLHYVDRPDYSIDETFAAEFYHDIRRFWPGLREGSLSPDYAGVRPKIHGPAEPQPDFCIADAAMHGIVGLVALFGIESPGLTASLAIGEEVAARLEL